MKDIVSINNIKLQLIDKNSDFEQFYSNTDTFSSLNKDKSNITSYEMTNKSFLEFSANLNVKGINLVYISWIQDAVSWLMKNR